MDNLYQAIYKGLAPLTKTAVQEALDASKTPQEIIDESMIPAMEAIGKDFESGRAFVPNLLLSARAMKAALDILKPLMMAEQTVSLGTVVIGTVKGDLHDSVSSRPQRRTTPTLSPSPPCSRPPWII